MTPLLRGRGVARGRERLLLLVAMIAPLFFVALPARLECRPGSSCTGLLLAFLFRGRTLRLHGAEHRAIAAVEERRLGPDVGRGGAPVAVRAALRNELRRARAAGHRCSFDRLAPVSALPVVTGFASRSSRSG